MVIYIGLIVAVVLILLVNTRVSLIDNVAGRVVNDLDARATNQEENGGLLAERVAKLEAERDAMADLLWNSPLLKGKRKPNATVTCSRNGCK